MISIRQIRAARALLGWKQTETAKASGIAVATLNYIENEIVSPRTTTLKALQKTFEDHGIELLPGDGLRLKQEVFHVQTYEGPNALRLMLEDAIETQKRHNEGAMWFGVSEDELVRLHRKDYFSYFIKLKEIGLTERVLTTKRQQNFYGPDTLTKYRLLNHEFFGGLDYGIFGNKFYLTSFVPRPRLIVIEHEGIVQGFKSQFETFWAMAVPAKNHKSGFEKDFLKISK